MGCPIMAGVSPLSCITVNLGVEYESLFKQGFIVDNLLIVNTAGELSELGTVSEISKIIEEKIHPLRISASSYEELLTVIECLKVNWLPLRKECFTSKRYEYIYYILEHDGEKRGELLGIEDEFYSDPKKARRWYKRIAQIIRADRGDSETATQAFQKLQDIYQDLTDDEAFGDSND